MNWYEVLTLLFALGSVRAMAPTSYLGPKEKTHLQNVLETTWAIGDLPSLFYGSLGLNLLKVDVPNKEVRMVSESLRKHLCIH